MLLPGMSMCMTFYRIFLRGNHMKCIMIICQFTSQYDSPILKKITNHPIFFTFAGLQSIPNLGHNAFLLIKLQVKH